MRYNAFYLLNGGLRSWKTRESNYFDLRGKKNEREKCNKKKKRKKRKKRKTQKLKRVRNSRSTSNVHTNTVITITIA